MGPANVSRRCGVVSLLHSSIGVMGPLALLVCLSASADGRVSSELEAGGAFLCGPIDGTLQTPSGGKPQTTSSDRPTLDELGIDHARTAKFWVNLRWAQNSLVFGGHLIRLSGDATLDTTLISQNRVFPAGAAVESDIQLDWYRLGYRRHISLECGSKTVELAPSLAAVLFPFHYELSSSAVDDVDRRYSKGGIQAGVDMKILVAERLELSARAALPIPYSNSVNILSTSLQAEYEFFAAEDRGLAFLLGVCLENICYEDNQAVPNDIEVDVGPVLFMGLDGRF